MKPIEIKPNIYWIGVNDRQTDKFESMWPIKEEGISYNSYLILDEKNVLVDLSKEILEEHFIDQIRALVDLSKIDYIVVNHMEPDHTGALHRIMTLAPQATILCTEKARKMLEAYYGIRDGVRVVADGETISLGKHSLQFLHIPFVHWPETMATYEVTEKILFSCDAFGGYGALNGYIFDDDNIDLDFYLRESLRYYSNIVASFSKPVINAVNKLSNTPISIIAPSHGLIWRKKPELISSLYKKWSEYVIGPAEKGITLLYGSMYGNTEKYMHRVAQGIASQGLPVNVFNVSYIDPSHILPSLILYQGVAVGAPTYNGGLFPPMSSLLEEVGIKRIRSRQAIFFGSYGWGGGAAGGFKQMAETLLKWDIIASNDFLGAPLGETLQQAEQLGTSFAQLIMNPRA